MIGKVCDYFGNDLKQYVDTLNEVDNFHKDNENYQDLLQCKVTDSFYGIAKKWEKLESQIEEDETLLNQVKDLTQLMIRPWIQKSYLLHRATIKPRGYPGDYEVIEGVYNNKCVSSGVGFYLDRFFLNTQLAEAVRNRKDFLVEFLKNEIKTRDEIRVFNLACGSCREWHELLPHIDGNSVQLTCIDHDQEALDYSKKRFNGNEKKLVINFVQENALKIAVGKNLTEKYGKQDIVYSVGLYDYLSDKPLKRLLKNLYSLLNPKGKMILAHKDKTKYGKTLYDWGSDWRFVPRNEDEVYKVLHDIGIERSLIKTEWEPSGTIIFFEINKP